jgi:hypothetical protein
LTGSDDRNEGDLANMANIARVRRIKITGKVIMLMGISLNHTRPQAGRSPTGKNLTAGPPHLPASQLILISL